MGNYFFCGADNFILDFQGSC